jgi:hypothetical protein
MSRSFLQAALLLDDDRSVHALIGDEPPLAALAHVGLVIRRRIKLIRRPAVGLGDLRRHVLFGDDETASGTRFSTIRSRSAVGRHAHPQQRRLVVRPADQKASPRTRRCDGYSVEDAVETGVDQSPDASTTSEATGGLSHAVGTDHEQRHVVARHLAGANVRTSSELLEKLFADSRQSRAGSMDASRRSSRPVASGIHRHHAVVERDDEVAAAAESVLLECCLLEETEHRAAGFETAHAARRHEHRGVVTAFV